MRARVLTVVLTFVVLGATSFRAEAQDAAKPDYAAAKRHFKAGQEFLQMDRYAEAVVEFRKAYDITKDGLVMGQVAKAYERAGDFEAALAAIRVYRESLPEGERTDAEKLIKDYEKAVKDGRSKKLVLPTDKPKADDQLKPDEKSLTTPPEDQPKRKGRFYTWIVAGAAGALALSALVVGLNAQSKYDELSDRCKPSCPASDVDSVRTRAIVTDVLWGTAAAAAVTAGVLFFLEGRSAGGAEKKEPGDGGEEESVSRRLRITPVVGYGRYGLSAGLKF